MDFAVVGPLVPSALPHIRFLFIGSRVSFHAAFRRRLATVALALHLDFTSIRLSGGLPPPGRRTCSTHLCSRRAYGTRVSCHQCSGRHGDSAATAVATATRLAHDASLARMDENEGFRRDVRQAAGRYAPASLALRARMAFGPPWDSRASGFRSLEVDESA
jgi:hypothetical protein